MTREGWGGSTPRAVSALLLTCGPVLLLSAVLAACGTDPKPLPVVAPAVPQRALASVTVVCPTLKAYSADDQHAMADALRALPASSPLVQAMADYKGLRDQVRACREPTPAP